MIEVKGLSKFYGKKQVLDDVSFTIKPNEITCLIGLNGAGKTTIMNAMMQLTPIQKGEVLLDGKPVTVNDFNRLAYVSDKNTLLKQMTIQEALDYQETYYASFNKKRASHLIEFFNLQRQDVIGKLSKGNLARANLLMAMSLDSDYLLMDEPFSGIDILTRDRIASIFSTDLLENQGILLATHEVQEVEHLIDKVVMLDEGRVIREFYPEEVRSQTGQSIVDVMKEVYGQEEVY